jgi:hypothetical protein
LEVAYGICSMRDTIRADMTPTMVFEQRSP